MTTSNAELNPSKFLKIEDAPPFGSGQLSIEDDRLYSGLAHLFSIIIWPWKRKASPAVDAHGKEALNMGITWFIIMFGVNIVLHMMPGFLAVLFSLVVDVFALAWFALIIYALLLARKGKLLRYPINFRLIK